MEIDTACGDVGTGDEHALQMPRIRPCLPQSRQTGESGLSVSYFSDAAPQPVRVPLASLALFGACCGMHRQDVLSGSGHRKYGCVRGN